MKKKLYIDGFEIIVDSCEVCPFSFDYAYKYINGIKVEFKNLCAHSIMELENTNVISERCTLRSVEE